MKRSIITILAFFVTVVVFGQAKKPSIMVVPSDVWCKQNGFYTTYDNQGVKETIADYERALQNDPDLTFAISKIGSMMEDRGFPLEDLSETIKNIKLTDVLYEGIESKKSGAKVVEGPNDKILRSAMPDIKMELTYKINKIGPKYSLTYILQGKDAYTGKQIASAEGNGKETFTAGLPVMLEEAIMNNMDNFCDRLMAYFEGMQENGREVSVEIRVLDNGSGLDFESEFDDMELSEIIENWMSDNTVNHDFNTKASNEYFMHFSPVHIPLYDIKGNQMSTKGFVTDLKKFLKKNYRIDSKITEIGLGRCILAIGEK